MSLHIEGRRWFHRGPGNTYHSVRIFRDGVLAVYLLYAYGYGDQWLQTAWDWLTVNGHPELGERHANGALVHYGTQYLREVLKGTYSVIDVARKKDL